MLECENLAGKHYMLWVAPVMFKNSRVGKALRSRRGQVNLRMRHQQKSRAFRKTWNITIRSVVHGLAELPKELSRTANGKRVLEAIEILVTSMVAPPLRYFATNRQLAKQYAISQRTITNWRREGCPFEKGKGAVLKWVARHRYAPSGMEAKFKERLFQLRCRKWSAEIEEGFAERRRLKLLRKHYDIPLDPDDKRLRCPKGGMTDPKVLVLKRRIDAECAGRSL